MVMAKPWIQGPGKLYVTIMCSNDDLTCVATPGAPRPARPPRFGPSYKKQLVQKIWSTILGLARLKFAVAPLNLSCY